MTQIHHIDPCNPDDPDSILDRTFYTVVKCSYGSVVGYRTTDFTYPADDGELIMNVGETIT